MIIEKSFFLEVTKQCCAYGLSGLSEVEVLGFKKLQALLQSKKIKMCHQKSEPDIIIGMTMGKIRVRFHIIYLGLYLLYPLPSLSTSGIQLSSSCLF